MNSVINKKTLIDIIGTKLRGANIVFFSSSSGLLHEFEARNCEIFISSHKRQLNQT